MNRLKRYSIIKAKRLYYGAIGFVFGLLGLCQSTFGRCPACGFFKFRYYVAVDGDEAEICWPCWKAPIGIGWMRKAYWWFEDFFKKLLIKIGVTKCTCPKECDCQNPPPDNRKKGDGGPYHLSNECPIHNDFPQPNEECPIHGGMTALEFSIAINH
ncbi:MAG: hypothetical protein HY764_04440 [Candidatus Portnoybacteria bacterium]|nr:hypothetical protein [Candidatus Portnoybacteria bacterium]